MKKYQRYIVTLSAALFFMYDFIQLNIFNSIGMGVANEFNLNASSLGFLAGSYLTAQSFALFFSGYFLDRFSTRNIILSGMAMCVLSTLTMSFAHDTQTILIARSIAGITGAFCFLSSLLITSTWFKPSEMSTIVGIIVTMGMLGGILAQSPMEYLNSHFSWRYALYVDGIIGIILFFWMFFIIKNGPLYIKKNTQTSFLKNIMDVLSEKQNYFASIYTSTMNLILFVFGAIWGNQYLMIVHNIPHTQASVIIMQLFIGTIIGSTLWGIVVDKTKMRSQMMTFGAILTLILLLILFNNRLDFNALTIIFFALGLTTAAQVLSYPHLAECNKPEILGLADSFAAIIIIGLGAIGQTYMGVLLDQARMLRGEHSLIYLPNDFTLTSNIFIFVIIVSIICAINIKKNYDK